jgi:hypothetical protein
MALLSATLLLALTAEPAYAPKQREAHLAQTLDAVGRTSRDALLQAYEYIAVYERGTCNASNERLRVECMMTAARRFCQKRPAAEARDCALYSDVVVTNLLAEKRLVPNERRYEIMRRSRDWRREVLRELRRQQGELAIDFRLRMGDSGTSAELARKLDAYCLQPPEAAGLSWQVCASSLIWFIGAEAPSP